MQVSHSLAAGPIDLALTVSAREAWLSLAAIASVVLVTLAGSGWAVWFAATSI